MKLFNYKTRNLTNRESSLKMNFIFNSLLTMSSLIFPIISFPYVSRILQPGGIGKVSFATSVITYFSMFAQLGIPTYGIRACAKVRDNKNKLSTVVIEIFIINIVTTVISYILFFILLNSVERLRSEKTLMLAMSSLIAFNTLGMEWLYKALEKYKYITTRSIIFKFVALISMFVFVVKPSDYVIYGMISIFAASASNILNFYNIHKYIEFVPLSSLKFRFHLKPILIFFAMSCATTIYTNLDTVMLGFMNGDTEVGYYNAAIKIKSVLVSVVTSLGVVLLPRASYYLENKLNDEFLQISTKAINFVTLVAIPLAAYFIIFAKETIFFLSGHMYSGSILPMQIIMPTLILIGLTNIMGIQMLVPLGLEKKVLISELAGALTNLIVNSILIPTFSSIGAAIGTLFAELLVWIFQYHALNKMVGNIYKNVEYKKIIIAIFIAVVLSLIIKCTNYSELIKLVLSSILFFGTYVLILFFGGEKIINDEFKQLKKRVKRG